MKLLISFNIKLLIVLLTLLCLKKLFIKFRSDLLKNEMKEIEVINQFLPKQLGEEETKKICVQAAKQVNASSMKDMGKVMGILKSNHGDVLDFSKVSSILKELLSKWKWNIQKSI